jgi:hypothetical protein
VKSRRPTNKRSRRRTAFVLARGLAVGLGAIALVVGVLAVFGRDAPDGGGSASAEALSERVTSGDERPVPSTTTATARARSAATGAAVDGATTPTAAPSATVGASAPAGAATPGAAVAGSPAIPSAGPAPSADVATTSPPPPPPTAAPVFPSATVAPGGGGAVVATLTDFPANTTVSVACWHIIVGQGPAQFDGYSATTDGSGSSTTSQCVWDQPGTHVYVLVTGPGVPGVVGSNHYQFPG